MRAFCILFAWYLTAVAGVPTRPERIVGGNLTTISHHPTIALLMLSVHGTFRPWCGGTVLNTRSILTAAHCPHETAAKDWRVRVGSSFSHSGGVVHELESIVSHDMYDPHTNDYDIAIMRTATAITYVQDAVQPATTAGPNYNLTDNQEVWAAGWGHIYAGGPDSEQLRHVQIWTVNQAICAQRNANFGKVTDNMLCAGWLDHGGRDQCQGDSGGPLYHNGIVVGITSWGQGCALPKYPGVNTRVSKFSSWIEAHK